MTDTGIQRAVDSLAETLRRSVVINDPAVRMLFASRHFNDEDEIRVRAILQRDAGAKAIGHVLAQGVSTWSTAGIIPANPALGMKARVCVPIRWRGEMLGQLMVMDGDCSLTTSELSGIEETARDIAASMAVRAHEDEPGKVDEQTLLDLIGTEPTLRRRALSELAIDSDSADFRHITAVEIGIRGGVDSVAASHAESALRYVLSLDFRDDRVTSAHAARPSQGTLILGSTTPLDASAIEKHVQKMMDQLDDLASGRFRCAAGIGSNAVGLEEAHRTAQQAHLARRGAATVLHQRVVRWSELGPLSVLLRVPSNELHVDALPDEVQRLLSVDASGDLVPTLRTYLDCACNGPAASDALHIHRTTLYYRLNRISELSGLDLSNGITRLSVHIGLIMLELIGGEATRR